MEKLEHKFKMIDLVCEQCGVIYLKRLSEYKRNVALGRKSFCSRSCVGVSNTNNLSDEDRLRGRTNVRVNSGFKKHDPFNYFIRITRKRFQEFDITVDDLKEQWNKQKGICPYSGIELDLRKKSSDNIDAIFGASLDRIDSKKGYVKGNVQFVSRCLNYMKNTLTHEETIALCKQIAFHYRNDI